jgi:hypothetical protein
MQLFMQRAPRVRRDQCLRKTSREGTATRFVTVCAWCERVRVGGCWLEMDRAIAQLRTFEWPEPPGLTHGICDDCFEQLAKARAAEPAPDTSRAA